MQAVGDDARSGASGSVGGPARGRSGAWAGGSTPCNPTADAYRLKLNGRHEDETRGRVFDGELRCDGIGEDGWRVHVKFSECQLGVEFRLLERLRSWLGALLKRLALICNETIT